jgi:hypothetical protein
LGVAAFAIQTSGLFQVTGNALGSEIGLAVDRGIRPAHDRFREWRITRVFFLLLCLEVARPQEFQKLLPKAKQQTRYENDQKNEQAQESDKGTQ